MRDNLDTLYGAIADGAAKGRDGAKTGAVTIVQRTSSDLRLHPHLHVIFLDGACHEQGDARGRA